MPYVIRDTEGRIMAVSHEGGDDFLEKLASDDEELVAFLRRLDPGSDRPERLESTDLSFVRVLEDVIELLIARNVIRFTDLPEAAQQKMSQRQKLRDALRPHLDLLDDDRDDGLV